MSAIAFVGLGIMGGPMARHLVKAGHDVVGHNRSPEKAEALAADGGRAAATVAEAVTGADVVALMLPDSPDVVDVCTRDGGVFDTAEPGTLVVDFSTIRPDVARDLAARAAERGLRMLDAPVSGGQAGAENAALSIMVGGEEADVAAARPLLDVVGSTVVHVGPSGAGQTVKAANQLIVAGNIALLAEAIEFLRAHGADLDAAVRVLGGRPRRQRRCSTSKAAEDAGRGLRARLPDRPAPQGPGHRRRLRPRGRGGRIPVGALVAQLVAVHCGPPVPRRPRPLRAAPAPSSRLSGRNSS
jgi:2-hydroxy-3-oxopropionate reductase